MDKKKLFRFLSVILIGLIFVLLGAMLAGQQFYGNYQVEKPRVEILDDAVFTAKRPEKAAECLVLTNSTEANSAHALEEIKAIFGQLKVGADYADISGDEIPDYSGYDKVVLAVEDYNLMGQKISELMDWVEEGGNVMVFFPPQVGAVFQSVCARLGIREVSWNMYELPGIRLKTELMLGGQGKDFMIEEPYESSLTLSLDEDCTVHIVSADDRELSEKFGCRYSGMMIEDYDDNVEAPFAANPNTQRFLYFGSSLLKNGGEIGLHGYNHIPLCREGFDENFGDGYVQGTYERLYDYGYWKTEDDMKASVRELADFTESLFPEVTASVYVPPSNILSDLARHMLAADGIVETPRVISGYILDPYMEMAAFSELNLHYVNSHFQHPDDVLDPDRGAEAGWEKMKNRLTEYLSWLYTAAPGIRNLTAGKMAGAVQRYFYLDAAQKITEDEIILTLTDFQDEGYLFIRISDRALDSRIVIRRGGE